MKKQKNIINILKEWKIMQEINIWYRKDGNYWTKLDGGQMLFTELSYDEKGYKHSVTAIPLDIIDPTLYKQGQTIKKLLDERKD